MKRRITTTIQVEREDFINLFLSFSGRHTHSISNETERNVIESATTQDYQGQNSSHNVPASYRTRELSPCLALSEVSGRAASPGEGTEETQR